MLIILARTVILYILIVVVMRLMGKQQIGQLQPFELVITIMISELAAIPMEDTGTPLLSGILPIITLFLAQLTFSFLSLKSEKARALICGRPSVLIEKGKIVDSELKRLRYGINDLLEQLRCKDFPNIADVEYAILETNGQLSVIPKTHKRQLVPEDLHIPTSYEGLPLELVIDGRVKWRNLEKLDLSWEWLQEELAKMGIGRVEDVLLASLDSKGDLYVQKKDFSGTF